MEPLNQSESWVSYSLIVAKYPKDDYLGMFYGFYSILVYNIHAVYITLFFSNRDLLTFWCCLSHLLSEILNYFVKHILKEPRPDNGAPSGGLFEGKYGMPSQHCHCVAFLVTSINLLVINYYRSYITRTRKFIVLIVTSTCLALQAHARIYLNFHTVNQCLVGIIFGIISASIFYLLGLYLLLPHSKTVCHVWPLRLMYFRKDLVSSCNLIDSSRKKEIQKSIKKQFKNKDS